jgi:hypothetical protein
MIFKKLKYPNKFFYKKSILLIFFNLSFAVFLLAQCDENIRKRTLKKVSNYNYQKRGENYCEGFIASPISAPSLDLVGLIRGELSYDLDSSNKPPIIVLRPDNVYFDEVNIRAVTIPLDVHYRMDVLVMDSTNFNWPLANVIFPNKIPAEYLGLYGWTKNESKTTYLPVSFNSNEEKNNL